MATVVHEKAYSKLLVIFLVIYCSFSFWFMRHKRFVLLYDYKCQYIKLLKYYCAHNNFKELSLPHSLFCLWLTYSMNGLKMFFY